MENMSQKGQAASGCNVWPARTLDFDIHVLQPLPLLNQERFHEFHQTLSSAAM